MIRQKKIDHAKKLIASVVVIAALVIALFLCSLAVLVFLGGMALGN